MGPRLWETTPVAQLIWTTSIQKMTCLCVRNIIFFLLCGVIDGMVHKALGLQLCLDPLHHRRMAKKLQNQGRGGAGCGGVSSEDQLYCCFLDVDGLTDAS